MKRGWKRVYVFFILAANASCCARIDRKNGVSEEEKVGGHHLQSIRYHYENIFSQENGVNSRDYLLKKYQTPPPSTDAPTRDDTFTPGSPAYSYFYKPLISFPRRSTPPVTPNPTPLPSKRPTPVPSPRPVVPPTRKQTPQPSEQPTPRPSKRPTPAPSPRPVVPPTRKPTPRPSDQPTPVKTSRPVVSVPPTEPKASQEPTPKEKKSLSFEPGNFSSGKRSTDGNILLSNGLSARPIAQAGDRVRLADGSESDLKFHRLPDGAAVFPSRKDDGWLYVSNAENDKAGTDWDDGGVGVLEFNAFGNITAYYKIAANTKRNCGGGVTPWNSFVTCEEVRDGMVHQTDPYGIKEQAVTGMGQLGYYESFAYWEDGAGNVTFYVTRDKKDGVVTRMTPDEAAMECYRKTEDYERWCTLDSGTIEYLYLTDEGKVEWTTDEKKAGENAKKLYPSSEGIDVKDHVLYFTSKEDKVLVIVDLLANTYTISSTKSGAFNNQPDQINKVLRGANAEILLLCEDGGLDAGLHGRNLAGDYFTILYRDKDIKTKRNSEETTGLGVSPDFRHLFVSFQHVGTIYDVTRDDGRTFNARVLDIKYHAMES